MKLVGRFSGRQVFGVIVVKKRHDLIGVAVHRDMAYIDHILIRFAESIGLHTNSGGKHFTNMGTVHKAQNFR